MLPNYWLHSGTWSGEQPGESSPAPARPRRDRQPHSGAAVANASLLQSSLSTHSLTLFWMAYSGGSQLPCHKSSLWWVPWELTWKLRSANSHVDKLGSRFSHQSLRWLPCQSKFNWNSRKSELKLANQAVPGFLIYENGRLINIS